MGKASQKNEETDVKAKIISEFSDIVKNMGNEKKSEREIARMLADKYGISDETIRTWWKTGKAKKLKSHGNMLLSNQDESVLVGILEGFSLSHVPLSRAKFLETVREIFLLPSDWEGYVWYNGFMERHSDFLNSRTVQAIKSERVSVDVLSNTEIFVKSLEKYFATYHFPASRVVNTDETHLTIKGNLFCVEYIESTQKKKLTHKQKRSGKTASLVVFAAADGTVLLSVYVIPVEFSKENVGTSNIPVYSKTYMLRGDWRRAYIFTDKGNVTDEAWNVIMDLYIETVKKIWGDTDSLLLLDRLGSHLQGNVIKR